MPYAINSDLSDSIKKHLPEHAQDIFGPPSIMPMINIMGIRVRKRSHITLHGLQKNGDMKRQMISGSKNQDRMDARRR